MAKTAREPLSESPCVYACWPGPVSPDQTNKHHGQEEQKRDYLVTILEALPCVASRGQFLAQILRLLGN